MGPRSRGPVADVRGAGCDINRGPPPSASLLRRFCPDEAANHN